MRVTFASATAEQTPAMAIAAHACLIIPVSWRRRIACALRDQHDARWRNGSRLEHAQQDCVSPRLGLLPEPGRAEAFVYKGARTVTKWLMSCASTRDTSKVYPHNA